MVLAVDDRQSDIHPLVELGNLPHRIRAAGDRDRLALEIGRLLNAARGLDDELGVDDERCQAERDRFLALEIVDGRSALEIDGSVRDQWHAVGGRDQLLTNFEIRHLQRLPQAIDDPQAKIDRVADGLSAIVRVRERNRGIAHAENYFPGIAQLLQRSRFLLRHRWNRGGEQGHAQQRSESHDFLRALSNRQGVANEESSALSGSAGTITGGEAIAFMTPSSLNRARRWLRSRCQLRPQDAIRSRRARRR